MTYWIDYGHGVREACDTLVKARATAIRMIEGGVYGFKNVYVYASKFSTKPVGDVYVAANGRFMWVSYSSKYGATHSSLFKNGKLAR